MFGIDLLAQSSLVARNIVSFCKLAICAEEDSCLLSPKDVSQINTAYLVVDFFFIVIHFSFS